ncbi:MAG: 23S rRNA (uracil(1939)-C(5))-methyltransferase RlmD [Candidatus Metalachnospira sp.]|jgi:23S rRNA (uracil1939-C5)-methyltransferase
MNLEKNKIYTVTCTSFGNDGEGIAKIDGFTLFIEGMIPGETGEVLILKLKTNYGYAKLVKLTEKSENRKEAECPYYKTCGGCSLQHIDYNTQLKFKTGRVKDCMERIGKLSEIEVKPTIGMDVPWNYRNKAQYPIGVKDGKAIMGFYAPRSHRITDIKECMIQQKKASEVLGIIKEYIDEFRISVYDEIKHKGLIRHVLTRTAFSTGEVMVTVVVNGRKIPKQDKLIEKLKRIDGLVSVVMNINIERTNVIMGPECKTVWGKDFIRDKIGNVSFDISSLSFYQVNPVQTEKLYKIAVEKAELTGNENVIDVYCGIGTISLFAAERAKNVYGVEVVERAIEDAKHNAEINNITNAVFEAGKAEEVLPRMYREGKKADVIFLDPPRKGVEPAVVDAVSGMNPDRIVYVSCDPATLARDLRLFEEKGYKAEEAQPVDMFCQTSAVETVVLLSKLKTNKHLR